MKKLIFVLFILLLFSGFIPGKYVAFKPVYQEGDRLVVSEEIMSAEFKENIKFVLRHYDKPYQESKNGNILIPETLWMDRDLLWNYTAKANDPAWLNSR